MRAPARRVAEAVGAFVAMEGVAYASHRWLMHGPAYDWHRSHHAPRDGWFERNDLFPVVFAGATVAAMAVGTAVRPLRASALTIGAAVTAYGAAYLVVHDGFIHGRMGDRVSAVGRSGPASRLVTAHRRHHVDAGEPFGMLLPLGSADRASRPVAARRPVASSESPAEEAQPASTAS